MQFHLPTQANPDATRPFVARLLSNGRVDASFGGEDNGQVTGTPNGFVVFPNPNVMAHINDLSILSSGKVLVAGRTGKAGGNGIMIQLNLDGTRDQNFGGPAHGFTTTVKGSVLYSDSSLTDASFRHIAVAPDGRIAIDGPQGLGQSSDVHQLILMFDADGSFSTGFADNGIYTETVDSNVTSRSFQALTFASDGTLIVSRTTRPP